MPVPKPVVKPIATKKGPSQPVAKPKATTASTTKKATTSKKQSCDISYPFGSPYRIIEPVNKTIAKIKKHSTIVEECSGKNCIPNKNKMTSEATSNAKPLKKDLAKKPTSTMTCSGEKCYLELPKKAPVKKMTKAEGPCYAEPATKKAQVQKSTSSKETCCTESKKLIQPKISNKKTAKSAVRKLMLPTTRKSKTDCASGWCNWDSDMSTDGSEGCACGMCSFDDSDCEDEMYHLMALPSLPKKKISTKKATKSTSNANKKCYLYK